MPNKPSRDSVGLPARVFFYTPDQIASMLEVTETHVKNNILWYSGREPGAPPKDRMRAINISPDGQTPIWRVSENAYIGWLKAKGIKFYERGWGS